MLEGVDKPLFRKSIAEPLNESSIIIQEELRTEDRIANVAMSGKIIQKIMRCQQKIGVEEMNNITEKKENAPKTKKEYYDLIQEFGFPMSKS